MVVSSCVFQRFCKRNVFSAKLSPAGPSVSHIHMNESLVRVDADTAVAKGLNIFGQSVHFGRSHASHYDVRRGSEQMPASRGSTYCPIVFRAAITAGNPNRQTCEVTKLLQGIHQPLIDLSPVAASTCEFMPGKVLA